jgi:hypothetical protein
MNQPDPLTLSWDPDHAANRFPEIIPHGTTPEAARTQLQALVARIRHLYTDYLTPDIPTDASINDVRRLYGALLTEFRSRLLASYVVAVRDLTTMPDDALDRLAAGELVKAPPGGWPSPGAETASRARVRALFADKVGHPSLFTGAKLSVVPPTLRPFDLRRLHSAEDDTS